MIVTDVKDGAYDSGVFLNAASFGPPAVLPVELTDFDASCKDGLTALFWETSSEINNDRFEVQKSTDGLNFYTIGSVDGAGNSSVNQQYAFQDIEQDNQVVYYRLKQVDFNGEYEYSDVVVGERCEYAKFYIDQVYYNSTQELVINYAVGKTNQVQINLFDVQGKLVQQEQLLMDKDQRELRMPIKASLQNGVYMVNVVSSVHVATKKIVVSK